MDLLYTTLSSELRKDFESMGFRVEDASDYIHEDRYAVHFEDEQRDEYVELLKKHKVLKDSLQYQTGNLELIENHE